MRLQTGSVVVGSKPDAGTIDGIVMTSAWLRGDLIYTAEVGDMESLRAQVQAFAGMRIMHA